MEYETQKHVVAVRGDGRQEFLAHCDERPGADDCRADNATSLPLTGLVAIIGLLCWTWPWMSRRIRRRRNADYAGGSDQTR